MLKPFYLRVPVKYAVWRKTRDKPDAFVLTFGHPVHEFMGAEMAVTPYGNKCIRPRCTKRSYKPLQSIIDIGCLVASSRTKQGLYEFSAMPLKDQ